MLYDILPWCVLYEFLTWTLWKKNLFDYEQYGSRNNIMDASSNFPTVNDWFTVNNFKIVSIRTSSSILKTDYSLHSYFVDN